MDTFYYYVLMTVEYLSLLGAAVCLFMLFTADLALWESLAGILGGMSGAGIFHVARYGLLYFTNGLEKGESSEE